MGCAIHKLQSNCLVKINKFSTFSTIAIKVSVKSNVISHQLFLFEFVNVLYYYIYIYLFRVDARDFQSNNISFTNINNAPCLELEEVIGYYLRVHILY